MRLPFPLRVECLDRVGEWRQSRNIQMDEGGSQECQLGVRSGKRHVSTG